MGVEAAIGVSVFVLESMERKIRLNTRGSHDPTSLKLVPK